MKKYLKRPFSFGKIQLPNNVFYAPLAGCSDYPFRQMGSRYRPGLMFSEMVKMDALIRNDPGTYHILDYDTEMHPIGGQLCGSKPEIAGKAAKIIEELGFDTVDLNCGCPVDKITKDGSGSGMLKNPELIGEVIANMVAAVDIPVTVKIRAGWDEESIYAPLITKIAEQAGATAICIHARTRKQAYKGPARWEWIKECVDAANDILVIGNGDVVSKEAAHRMFEETGCDAVLVARGTLGHPWIVQDILEYLEGKPSSQRSLEDCREALMEHFEYTTHYHHPKKAVTDMRRIGCWYLKRSSGTKTFRERISKAASLDEVRDLIRNFPLEEILQDDMGEACEEEC